MACTDSPTGHHVTSAPRYGDAACIWCLEPTGATCARCGHLVLWEDEVWAMPDGASMGPPDGDPYHVECAP